MICIFIDFDCGVRSNPIPWSVIKITIARFGDILLNINLFETVFEIDG